MSYAFNSNQNCSRAYMTDLVQKPQDFGFNAFRQHGGDNALISPLGLTTALCMLHTGAKGKSADAISSVLGVDNSEVPALKTQLSALQRDSLADVSFATKAFVAANAQYPGDTEVEALSTDTTAATAQVNNWVERETRNKIRDLVPPGAITKLTRLVLANAVYYNGQWEEAFNEDETQPGDFFAKGGRAEAQFMTRKSRVKYADVPGASVLCLPFKGRFGMTFVLPEGQDLDTMLKDMSAEDLHTWRGWAHTQKVTVKIPRFEQEFAASHLKKTLSGLGLADLFTDQADLSGFGDGFSVSDVFQKTAATVNEAGAEVASGTALLVKTRGISRPKTFVADRPFLYALMDKETSALVTLGRVDSL